MLLQKSDAQVRRSSWKNAAGRREDQLPRAGGILHFFMKVGTEEEAEAAELAESVKRAERISKPFSA